MNGNSYVQGTVVGAGGDACYAEANPYSAFEASIDNAVNGMGFSNVPPSQAQGQPQAQQVNQQDVDYLAKFMSYIKSQQFGKDVNRTAQKFDIPPAQIAKGFLSKVLGVIADVLGIVINTICNVVDFIVDVLAGVLHGAVEVIHSLATGLTRVITFNNTTAY